MIARFVLRQQDEVPSGAVDDVGAAFGADGFLFALAESSAAGTVGLGSDDGLERHVLFTCLFGGFLPFLVQVLAVVQQVFDAVHVAMIGQRDGLHSGRDTFIHYLLHFRHSVQQRVVRVHM